MVLLLPHLTRYAGHCHMTCTQSLTVRYVQPPLAPNSRHAQSLTGRYVQPSLAPNSRHALNLSPGGTYSHHWHRTVVCAAAASCCYHRSAPMARGGWRGATRPVPSRGPIRRSVQCHVHYRWRRPRRAIAAPVCCPARAVPMSDSVRDRRWRGSLRGCLAPADESAAPV